MIFESLWEASFDREGEKDPFEFERLKDFIRTELITTRQQARKEAIEEILKFAQENFESLHGGGNGRRLVIQFIKNLQELLNQ